MRGLHPLSVNNLVHIPGFGDFQMSCIRELDDPYEIIYANRKKLSSDDEMKAEGKNRTVALYTADPEKQVFIYIFYAVNNISLTSYCKGTNNCRICQNYC